MADGDGWLFTGRLSLSTQRWLADHAVMVIPPPIPDSVMEKPPSAELRPDQKDVDSLPSYEELDPVIEAYVEEDRSPEEIVASGADRALVERIVGMIDLAEYKRRQAPPGVKITPKAFGRDRRLPITNAYRRSRPAEAEKGPTSPRAT